MQHWIHHITASTAQLCSAPFSFINKAIYNTLSPGYVKRTDTPCLFVHCLCRLSLLRRPTLVGTDFIFCPWPLFYFLTIRHELSKPGQRRPGKKYIRGLVLGWTWSIHSDILPTPPLNFAGGQKVRNFGSIFDTSRLWHCVVSKRSTNVERSNSCSLSEDDWTSFWLRNFTHPSPNFYTGSNISKFGQILDFEAL